MASLSSSPAQGTGGFPARLIVKPVTPEGKPAFFSTWHKEKDDALAEKDKALKTGKYRKVVIYDLESRTETTYTL